MEEHETLAGQLSQALHERILPVVVETPKGSRNKFAFDRVSRQFVLKKILPRGMVFPFDFGFVPGTRAEDGDPLDVLLLMEEPAFTGCRVECRLLGILKATQKNGKGKVHNDRLLGVPIERPDAKSLRTHRDLSKRLLGEIEHFFVAYHDLDSHRFTGKAWGGPKVAWRAVVDALEHLGRMNGR